MKRRAVRLIVGWLLEQDAPDWVLDVACRVLICADLQDWQAFLVVVGGPVRASDVWWRTAEVHHMIGKPFGESEYMFSVPVGDILASEMFMQLLEFECEPDYFEFEYPAPVDIVDCGTR